MHLHTYSTGSQYLCSLRYLLCTYTHTAPEASTFVPAIPFMHLHTYSTGSQYICSLRYLLCTYTHTAPEASTFVPCDTFYVPTHIQHRKPVPLFLRYLLCTYTHTAPEASTFVPCDTFYAPTHIQHRKPVPLFLAIPFMHLHTYSTGSQYLCSLRYLLCTYTHTAPEASTFVPCDTFYAPTHIQHRKPIHLFLAIPFMHLHTYSTGSQYLRSLQYLLCTYTHTAPEASTFVPCDTSYAPTHIQHRKPVHLFLRYLLCTYTHTAPEASTFVPCDTFYAPTHIQHRKPVHLFLAIPFMYLHTYSTGSQYLCSCDTFYAPTHIQHRKPVPLFLAIPFMHLHTYSTGSQYLCSLRYLLCTYTHTAPEASTFVPCDTFYAPTHIQHRKPVPLFLAIPFMHLHTYSTGSQYLCSLRYLLCTYTHTAPEASTFVPAIPFMHLHTYSTGSQYLCSCDTFYAPTHIQHRKPVPLFLAIPFMHLHTYSTGRQYLCTFYAPTHTISYLWHGRECCTQNIALRTASRAIFCVQHSLQLLRKHYPAMFANSYAEGGILQYTDNDYKDFLDMQRGRTTCLDSLHKENLYCVLLLSHVINDIIVPCPTMPFINSHFTRNAIALAISHAMP